MPRPCSFTSTSRPACLGVFGRWSFSVETELKATGFGTGTAFYSRLELSSLMVWVELAVFSLLVGTKVEVSSLAAAEASDWAVAEQDPEVLVLPPT